MRWSYVIRRPVVTTSRVATEMSSTCDIETVAFD